MARALDKLAERGPWEVISTICLQAISFEKIPLTYLHSDTTSISVCGLYEDADGHEFVITYGYSKEKRPDLKQFLYGLSVTPDKVPVCGEVKSGNTSDKTWNFDFIAKLAQTLDKDVLKKVIYVADSALVNKDNLKQIEKYGLRFISRLPGNFSLENRLKEKASAKGVINLRSWGVFPRKKMPPSTKSRNSRKCFTAGLTAFW